MVFKRRRGGGMSKRKYVRKERQKKREAKKMTEEDISQNFVIKDLSKKVRSLTASEKAYAGFATAAGTWVNIPTIVGISTDASMGGVVPFTLTPIAIGTGVGDRTGASITVRHFQIDYSVRLQSSTSSTDNGLSLAIRVMVVCFHKPNGVPGDASSSVVPSYHDLFAIQGPGSGMTRSFLRNQYQPFSKNFTVYYDRLHELNINSSTNNVFATNFLQHGRMKIRPTKKNSVVTFNTTSGASQDVLENQWVIIVMSDNSTTADANPPSVIIRGLVMFDQ